MLARVGDKMLAAAQRKMDAKSLSAEDLSAVAKVIETRGRLEGRDRYTIRAGRVPRPLSEVVGASARNTG